jgi:hypothetical protein
VSRGRENRGKIPHEEVPSVEESISARDRIKQRERERTEKEGK